MKITFGMDIKEKWKKIKGWSYKVSNFGRIKRSGSSQGTRVGKILKPSLSNQGYLKIVLSKNMKVKTFSIHRLVAEAFIGPCPKDKQVNHIDGIKKNNAAWNLEYLTRSDNMKHAYKLGLKKPNGKLNKKYNCGSSNANSKLNDKTVRQIRRKYKTGKYTQKELAEKFDTTQAQVNGIVNYKRWSHVV